MVGKWASVVGTEVEEGRAAGSEVRVAGGGKTPGTVKEDLPSLEQCYSGCWFENSL